MPLAATWLMMASEGPLLAAVIARLPEPKFNLAAYGVAFAFAILVESPVIMMMSASTALVEDATSFRRLRNFTYSLNAVITGVMLLLLFPPLFNLVLESLIGLPHDVARLTHRALIIMLPWPAAIGYRRFYQGLLIRGGKTRLVAYGTIIRFSVMASVSLALFHVASLPGAYLAAVALSSGVCVEALAARLMARRTVRELIATQSDGRASRDALDYGSITRFYIPLAMTSVLGLAVHPMVTFFMGGARFAIESLAVLPVVNSLSFIFRAMGLSYQEVAIALLGKNHEHAKEIGRFAIGLGLASSLGLALIGFTPFARVWFETISGLSPDLAAFAIIPTRILAPLPALSVFLSYQRAILVQGRYTRPITVATGIEVAGIAIVLMTLIHGPANMVGVTAAAIAFVAGRLADNAVLAPPCARALKASRRALERIRGSEQPDQ